MKNQIRLLLSLFIFVGLLFRNLDAQTSITVGGSTLPTNGNMAAGVTAGGVPVPLLVQNDGTLVTSGGGGGGGASNITQVNSVALPTGSVTQSAAGLPVRAAPQQVWRTTFSNIISNGVDPTFWTLVQTGSGQTVNQTGGNLVLTSGTTANSETIIRSTNTWQEAFNLRFGSLLSQRIANNNFYVELVDVIQDAASYTINSSTSVTVTFTSNPFTSQNVGQTMYLGAITGAAGVPMKGTIASVAGSTVTYTVAGWPGTGSGTLSVYGWNYHHVLFTGTTATQVAYDAQRNGWASGDTTATINTSASPGTVIQLTNDAGISSLSDSLVASTTTPAFVTRASRFQNLPTNGVQLYLQIRVTNGTTNPATTTTWTMNFMAMEDFAAQPVSIGPSKLLGAGSTPITVQGGTLPTVTTVGTVSTVTSLTTLANGQTAHSTASTGSPVRAGGRVNTAIDTTLVQGDASDLFVTSAGQLSIKPYGTSETDWQYATPIASPITNTTAVALKAAGAASVRNYVTGLQYINTSVVASVITIQDGSTVIWTGYAPASMTQMVLVTFPTPLRGSAATAMNFVVNTTATSTFVSAQGYQSF